MDGTTISGIDVETLKIKEVKRARLTNTELPSEGEYHEGRGV